MDINELGGDVDGHCQYWKDSGWTLFIPGGLWMDPYKGAIRFAMQYTK